MSRSRTVAFASAAVIALAAVATFGCNSGQPSLVQLQETPAATATPLPATPPAATPTPAPTVTATPRPSATPTVERPTYTPRPRPATATPVRPTRTPIPTINLPTRTPRPTSTPTARQRAQSMVNELPWVSDGLADTERNAYDELSRLSRDYPGVSEVALRQGWFDDGASRAEVSAVQYLRWMAKYAEPTVLSLLRMQFLQTVEPADAVAITSLYRLARSADEGDFERVMAHRKIADGIDDDEAKIVAVVYGTNKYRPESVDFLLRGAGVYLEERVIELPQSGEVLLAIIRIRDKTTPNMDYLEHSVRTIEAFMGEPFVSNYIALLFDDALTPGAGGNYFGTHMAMALLYDVENGHWWGGAPSTIAHEVAHYYWSGGNADWIDEGAATFVSSISENARDGTSVQTIRRPCASAKNIAELEALEAERNTNAFRCNYSLGEALFVNLYHGLGEETFRQGFGNLYRKSLVDDSGDGCRGRDLGICHLEAAFKTNVSPEVAALVDEIVGRWYYGTTQ